MASLELASLADTARLGSQLAAAFLCIKPVPLLLRGDLGSGKTTLTAEIVRQLPGGSAAEVSSPSFTICNMYPCMPPVLHCDLYRCEGDVPEEVWEFMDNGDGLLIVEWGGRMKPMPPEYLDICLNVVKNKHLAVIGGHGPAGLALAKYIGELWHGAQRALQ